MWEENCEEVDRCLGGIIVTHAWKFISNIGKERKDEGSMHLIQNKNPQFVSSTE